MFAVLAVSLLLTVASHVNADAMTLLARMSSTLAESKTIMVAARIQREQVDQAGQTLDSYVTMQVVLKRPNRLYTATAGDVRPYETWYDGNVLTVYFPGRGRPLQGTYRSDGEVLLHARARPAQAFSELAPFLVSNPYAYLKRQIKSARVIGRVFVGDAWSYHLAFRGTHIDWQLWVTADDAALPTRFAVIFKDRPHQPRIVVEFIRWDLDAPMEPSLFRFHRPLEAPAIFASQ